MMKSFYSFSVLMMTLFTMALTSGCSKKQEVVQAEEIRPVKTILVKAPDAGGIRHFPGRIDANRKAELAFRHKLLRLLRDRDLISEERIDLLLSWRHSGFNIHNHTTVYPNDTEGLHRLACYLHRAPVNLSRLRYHSESGLLIYEPKAGQEVDDGEPIDPLLLSLPVSPLT